MSDDRKKRGGSGALVFGVVGLLFVLPILYVLSIGPAFWLWSYNDIPFETMQAAYAPLFFVINRSEWAKEALRWYVDFWLPS